MAPEAMAQTTTGTNRMRPRVMRFGMLKVQAFPVRQARPPRTRDFESEYNDRHGIAPTAFFA
jgi:hypothetical protein